MIRLASQTEDIKRALNSVLESYFVGGQTKFINGGQHEFPDCVLYYDIRELETDKDSKKPIIAIVGSRTNTIKYKCQSLGIPGTVNRVENPRTVYVKVLDYPVTWNGNHIKSKQYADIVWSLLNAVFKTKKTEFLAEGIEKIEFTDGSDDASNDQETILIGTLNFQADVFSYAE